MSVRDEGRSLGAGLRRQAPNHLERLGLRAPVVSVKEKARRDCVRCGSGRRTRVNHRRSVESVWTTSEPESSRCPGISAGGDPLTASVASGIKVARVRSWLEQGTWEPVASMLREKLKWKTHESLSTDAGHRGGWACSSDSACMGMREGAQSPCFVVGSTQRWEGSRLGNAVRVSVSSSSQPSDGEELGRET